MMAHGTNYASSNKNIPPSTSVSASRVSFAATTPPPTRRRDNPRNPFQEHRVVSTTGATPQKGRKMNHNIDSETSEQRAF